MANRTMKTFNISSKLKFSVLLSCEQCETGIFCSLERAALLGFRFICNFPSGYSAAFCFERRDYGTFGLLRRDNAAFKAN